MTVHELMGRAHAAAVHATSASSAPGAAHLARRVAVRGAVRNVAARIRGDSRGQGTVEYVGLILLIAVLIAGVVQASHSFTNTGIAEAVVKKIKGAIDGVSEAK
jgi:hypothetical protein